MRLSSIVLVVGLAVPGVALAQGGLGLSDPDHPGSGPGGAGTPADAGTPTGGPGDAPPRQSPPPRPGTDPGQAVPGAQDDERMRVLVVDAATFAIDPVVGQVVSARMRSAAEEIGYEVLSREDTVAAAQQLPMPYPPTPADLWRVSWVARVHRGAFARVWAHGGQYVVEITVASLDGGGPFFARGAAGADDLREVVDRLMRTALPRPDLWNAEGAQAVGTVARPPPAPEEVAGDPIDELDDVDELDTSDGRDVDADEDSPEPEEPEAELRRWQLTLQTEAAIGAAEDVYYNHLVGLRLDFRITRDIMLGAYVAYANLNAREGRADNILFMLQFENRIRLSSDLDLTIPLRGAVGYLPFNGPVIRLAAGLNYALTPDWEIGIDLLTPTFWFLPDRTAISLDIAIEGTLRF